MIPRFARPEAGLQGLKMCSGALVAHLQPRPDPTSTGILRKSGGLLADRSMKMCNEEGTGAARDEGYCPYWQAVMRHRA